MLLSKTDALFLCKVLFYCEKTMNDPSLEEELYSLNKKLEEYLLDKANQPASVGTQDEIDSHVEDDLEEDLEEESKDELPEADKTVAGSLLHDLQPIDTDHGLLEFEEEEFDDDDEDDDEQPQVNLIVDGDFCDDAVSLLRRNGKTIDVWLTTGEKFCFELRKLNKDWKKIFTDGLVYKVG